LSDYDLTPEEIERLIAEARQAYHHAYVPYSCFPVGAALLTSELEGSVIIQGCNVENASYGLAICAERVAVCKAVSAGYRHFKAIAITAEKTNPCFPCGTCRQFIHEFGDEILVVIATAEGPPIVRTISEMLPLAFTSEDLYK
jgi:cytidine deaminase